MVPLAARACAKNSSIVSSGSAGITTWEPSALVSGTLLRKSGTRSHCATLYAATARALVLASTPPPPDMLVPVAQQTLHSFIPAAIHVLRAINREQHLAVHSKSPARQDVQVHLLVTGVHSCDFAP